jgi:predicted RNA-binding Zn ribbon-like protein
MASPTDEFLFIGEHPVLDWINTEIAVRGKPQDLVATPAALERWWQAAQTRYPNLHLDALFVPDADILATGKAFRATLRRMFTDWIREGKIEQAEMQSLNVILSESMLTLHQYEDGSLETRFVARTDSLYALWVPIAVETLQLLTTVERERLHECHNDRCVLLFLDTTRSQTRQWCSLACLERERSRRRHHERHLIIDNE